MKSWTRIAKIKNHLLDMFYPKCCPVCHKILQRQTWLICPQCLKSLPLIQGHRCMKCGKNVKEEEEYCKECRETERHFTQGRGIYFYDEIMKASILRYKYGGSRNYGDFYAAALCKYAEQEIRHWKPDLIIPVPLHRKNYKERGFNQAEYLAEKVSSFYDIPTSSSLVKKVKKTKSQKHLDAKARRENLNGVFQVSERVDGYRILVIDDVYTTGSTMDEIAACLKEKGAENVYFLTVCSGFNW